MFRRTFVAPRLFLRLAWGPRRVTSSTRYGTLEKSDAYPKGLKCTPQLLVTWALQRKNGGLVRWYRFLILRDQSACYVVVSPSKAEKRIENSLPKVVAEPLLALSVEEVEALLAARFQFRLEKKFKEADEIRDRLESFGVVVKDVAIPKTNH